MVTLIGMFAICAVSQAGLDLWRGDISGAIGWAAISFLSFWAFWVALGVQHTEKL